MQFGHRHGLRIRELFLPVRSSGFLPMNTLIVVLSMRATIVFAVFCICAYEDIVYQPRDSADNNADQYQSQICRRDALRNNHMCTLLEK